MLPEDGSSDSTGDWEDISAGGVEDAGLSVFFEALLELAGEGSSGSDISVRAEEEDTFSDLEEVSFGSLLTLADSEDMFVSEEVSL